MAKITTPFDELSDSAFVRLHQLVPDVIPCSVATIHREIAAGRFPKPYRIGRAATAYSVFEIREYLRNLKRADEVEAGIQKSVRASLAARVKAKAEASAEAL